MGKTRTEASRAERKAKKRAAEDAIPDVPDSWTAEPEAESSKSVEKDAKKRKRDGDEEDNVTREEEESKNERKRRKKEAEAGKAISDDASVGTRKEKKSKKGERQDEAADVGKADAIGDLDTEMTDSPATDAPKKSKKERKAERKAREAAEAAADGTAITKSAATADAKVETNGSTGKVAENGDEKEKKKSNKNNRNREKKRKGANASEATNGGAADENASSKAARFIVFVGQLPFTATKESVEKHFASIKPKSVRVPTEKGQAGKAKGFAFVEFEGYDHMKTCLKLFHHSLFNDGISAAREINVNLTAGGGGNTKERKGKIEEKNQKLDEERVRRRQEEEKAKFTKRAEGVKKDPIDESAIHPSRRGRVPVMK